MFLPIGTDAPLYYRPFITVGIIVANFAVFVATGWGEMHDGWLLTFGNGLHPGEWLRSAFLHFGIGHLVGNMVFLFIFGLVIEGKLGPVRFGLLYLVLCLLDGFVGQFLMLGYTGLSPGAGGASGVIFALMVIAWLWAPKNCIEFVFVLSYFWISTFELTLQTVAIYYLGTNLLFAWAMGFEMSTPVLHLLGAGVGLGAGLLMLQQEWVDCEGWDLLSLRGGDQPRNTLAKVQKRSPGDSPAIDHPYSETRLQQVEDALVQGRFEAAWQIYEPLREAVRPQRLPKDLLEKLLKGIVRAGNWNAAESVLREFLERFDEEPIRHRLALASLLTRQLQRPRAALKVLEEIPRAELDHRSMQRFQQIHCEAMGQIQNGVLEIRESL